MSAAHPQDHKSLLHPSVASFPIASISSISVISAVDFQITRHRRAIPALRKPP